MHNVLEDMKNIEKVDLDVEYKNASKNIDFNDMERMHDFCDRVYGFFFFFLEKYKDNNVLIVCHGGVSVPITCYFTKYNLEDLEDRSVITGLKNCEIAKYII